MLSRLQLKAANGLNAPLESLATIRPSVGPLAVNRIAQQPAVTISFNTAPGISLRDAVNAIRGPGATSTCQRRSPAASRVRRSSSRVR